MASKESEKKFYHHPLFLFAIALLGVSVATGVSNTALEASGTLYIDPVKTRITCAAGLGEVGKLYASQPAHVRQIAGPNMNKDALNINLGANIAQLGGYVFCTLGKDHGGPTGDLSITISR